MLRHLILGAGNMGRKHASILESLGDFVQLADLEFKVDGFDFSRFDSVLVCSPPETHRAYIEQLAPVSIPLFIEKPVQTESGILSYPGISMVACNWRWCKCLPWHLTSRIVCGYPTAIPLDLIHFVDLFWMKHGKPKGSCRSEYPVYTLEMWNDEKQIRVDILAQESGSWIELDGRMVPFEHKDCDMFLAQMKDWQATVHGKQNLWNSIQTASERTNWLIDRLSASSPTPPQESPSDSIRA